MALQSLQLEKRKTALEKIGEMRDDRLLDFLINHAHAPIRAQNPALTAIGNYIGVEKVQARLWQSFTDKGRATRERHSNSLAKDPAEKSQR